MRPARVGRRFSPVFFQESLVCRRAHRAQRDDLNQKCAFMVAEPIGALLGYLFLVSYTSPAAYGILFGAVAGMMVRRLAASGRSLGGDDCATRSSFVSKSCCQRPINTIDKTPTSPKRSSLACLSCLCRSCSSNSEVCARGGSRAPARVGPRKQQQPLKRKTRTN